MPAHIPIAAGFGTGVSWTVVVGLCQHFAMRRRLKRVRAQATARLEEERREFERRLEEERTQSKLVERLAVQETIQREADERREKWEKRNRDYPVPVFLEPYVAKALEDPTSRHVNIALVGDPGTGKSSLLKAILQHCGGRVSHAPKVGPEGTAQPEPYSVGGLKSAATVWDLPGHGTTRFPAKSFSLDVGLKYYDFLLLVTSGRWTENNARLLQAIKVADLKFCIVRTKVDQAVEAGECERGLRMEDTLWSIRALLHEACKVEPSRIHLVTSRERHWARFGDLGDLWSQVLREIGEA